MVSLATATTTASTTTTTTTTTMMMMTEKQPNGTSITTTRNDCPPPTGGSTSTAAITATTTSCGSSSTDVDVDAETSPQPQSQSNPPRRSGMNPVSLLIPSYYPPSTTSTSTKTTTTMPVTPSPTSSYNSNSSNHHHNNNHHYHPMMNASHHPSTLSQQHHRQQHHHQPQHHRQPPPQSATSSTSSTVYRFQPPTYVYNTEHSNHLEELKGSAGCNCKKSRCLKLYCQCFAASTTCGSKCRCEDCFNTTEHGLDIDTARRNIMIRNPIAFHKAKILLMQQQQEERHPHNVMIQPQHQPVSHHNNNNNNNNYPPHPNPPPPPPYNPYYMMPPGNGNHTNNNVMPPDHYYPNGGQQPQPPFRRRPHHHPPLARNPSHPPPPPPPPPIVPNENTHHHVGPSTQQYYSSSSTTTPQYENRHPHPQQPPPPKNHSFVDNVAPESSQQHTSPSPQQVPEYSHNAIAIDASVEPSPRQITSQPPPPPPSLMILPSQRRIQMVQQDGCNCRRTNCLKKYCDCFQQAIYCCSDCKCMDCHNHPGATAAARLHHHHHQQQQLLLQQQQQLPPPTPQMMMPSRKIKVVPNDGCNCRRTNCLKKYCDCFQQAIYCSGDCKCKDCHNYPGATVAELAVQQHVVPPPVYSRQNHNSNKELENKENCRLTVVPAVKGLPSSCDSTTGAPRWIKYNNDDVGNIALQYRPEVGEQSTVLLTPLPTTISAATLETTGAMNSFRSSHHSPNTESHPSPLPTTEGKIKNSASTSVRHTEADEEEGSPRCVVIHNEPSTTTRSVTTTADDAMIQAAMAMTELLNGIASTHVPPVSDTPNDIPHNSSSLNNTLLLSSSSSSSNVRDERPMKKLKLLDNLKMAKAPCSTSRATIADYSHRNGMGEATHSDSNARRIPHHLWSPQLNNPPQRHHRQPWHPINCQQHQDQKPMTHHRRSLPISSRHHLITTTSSSSPSSTSSSPSTNSNECTITTSNDSNIPRPVSNFKAATTQMDRCSLYETITLTSGLPKSLSFRKICSRCGRTRSEHGEMGFGNACLFDHCGRCGATAQCHQQVGQMMGVLCQLTVNDGATAGASAIYHRKLQALAARAELIHQNINRRKRIMVDGQ